jgi:hypothetical protein
VQKKLAAAKSDSSTASNEPALEEDILDPRGFFTRVVRAHPGYTIAVATFTVTALKIMGIALFDANTAFGLLASADTGRLLLGVFISVFPILAVTATGLSAGMFGVALASGRLRYATFMLLIIGATVSMTTAQLMLLGFGAAMSTFIGLTGYITFRGSEKEGDAGSDGIREFFTNPKNERKIKDMLTTSFVALVLTVVVLVQFALYGSEPWVAAERINLGSREVVGYVIAEDNGWTTILGASDRLIELVPSATVTGRALCTPWREPWGRTLIAYLGSSPVSPACPFPD